MAESSSVQTFFAVIMFLGLKKLPAIRQLDVDILLYSRNGFLDIFGVIAQELSRFDKDETISTSQATPMSQSPEIAAGDDTFSGYKVDIWSCGITL